MARRWASSFSKAPTSTFEMAISAAQFNAALASWPGIAGERIVEVLDIAMETARQEIIARTPRGATGKAQDSWIPIKAGPYSRAIASFLIYIRRLEVGWGARRLGVRKGRRARLAGLRIAGRKMPIGGYRMMTVVAEQRMTAIIQEAALEVLVRHSSMAA